MHSNPRDVEADGMPRETDHLVTRNGNGTNRNGTNRNGTNGNGVGYGTNGDHQRTYNFKRRTRTFVRKAYDKVTVVLFSNYVNYLLVFVPLGMASGFFGWDPTTNFILNFLAIIPLAAMLSFATEQLSKSVGPTLGGLLNATFGNAVELIVSVPSVMEIQLFPDRGSYCRGWLNLLTFFVSAKGQHRRSEQR